jgi:hypothetical protein
MIVCFAEQRAGLSRRPLSQILQSNLDAPLYVLSGLYPQSDARPGWLTQVAAWIGSIAIILGFFLLQIGMEQHAKDWAIALQLLSIPVEFWLIWVWNGLLG